MRLKLQVSNDLRQQLGADAEYVFDQRGGTIGRAQHNDWVLPDPKRYVSSVHASIEARDGGFYLVDTSMNGVYINGSKQPLGPTQPYK
ncbi:MAG: FHA domain-containing protein, partial [Pseudomonadota bacterium]